jgi:hypothetical protein
VALLAAPVALTALSGNFGALQLTGLVALWVWRDRPVRAGTLVACLVAVKLTPISLVIWLAATGRTRALVAFSFAGATLLILSIVGAGMDSWRAWIHVAGDAGPSPLSIASLTGLSPFAVFSVFMITTAAVGVLRRDRVTFAVAIVAGALATPALYFQALGPIAALGAGWMVRNAPRRVSD